MYKTVGERKVQYFNNLQEVADFLGYSYSYVAQKMRMGYELEGYFIEKCSKEESRMILAKATRGIN